MTDSISGSIDRRFLRYDVKIRYETELTQGGFRRKFWRLSKAQAWSDKIFEDFAEGLFV